MMAQQAISLDYPFDIYDLDEDEKNITDKLYQNKFVRIGRKKWFAPAAIEKYGPMIYNLNTTDKDVWLSGHIRSGTSVFSELVWLILNNADTEYANSTSVRQRCPNVDHLLYFNPDSKPDSPEEVRLVFKSFEELKQESTRKRCVKSHLPFELLPKNILESGAKIIYIIRDPKEVIVSTYKIYALFSSTEKYVDFKEFWTYFKKDLTLWAPFFEHVKEAWERRHNENVLIVYYDSLAKDYKRLIAEVASFLGQELTAPEFDNIQESCKYHTFVKPKKVYEGDRSDLGLTDKTKQYYKYNPDSWKEYFTGDLEQDLFAWIEDNIRGVDFKFTCGW